MRLRAGTRGSALARWQTATAIEALRRLEPALEVETVVVTTRGDVDLSFTTVPDLVDVTTDVSDILIALPNGDYDIDAVSRRGTVTIDGLTNTPDAGSVIVAHTTRGNVVVNGR